MQFVLGSTRASRVPTGALAGRKNARPRQNGEDSNTASLFREGAKQSTRGACAPHIYCMVTAKVIAEKARGLVSCDEAKRLSRPILLSQTASAAAANGAG